ncbi:MAG: sulfite exporter TauE/SafE family protein [Ignavibacteriaceae bacterium]
MPDTLTYFFIAVLGVTAFMYSSVGHGGASGYLAAMALFGISSTIMKPSALIMNIIVSSTAFYHFYKVGYFRWKLFLFLAAVSIPSAYIGASIFIPENYYRKILGAILMIPFLKLSFSAQPQTESTVHQKGMFLAGAGGLIGFISGMIGIGGGIILSPLLLFLKLTDIKETAAISAAFILVNSLSGLTAIIEKNNIDSSLYYWMPAAFAGACAGGYLGAKRFKSIMLKRILAVVLLIAAIKLLIT